MALQASGSSDRPLLYLKVPYVMIRGNSILLRALEPRDVDLMMIYENDPEVWPVSGTLAPYSRYTLEQYYANATQDIYAARQLRLAIELITELPGSGDTIGYIDLFDFDAQHRRAGIGILIGDVKQRQKGFAAEALSLLVKHCFNTLNLHQLYCHIDNRNERSLRLFSKAGFRTCGVMRDWIVYNGEWHNVSVMQLIRPKVIV
ncbi:MAG: GNAT family N-acetyltransferase [Bacteroidia bacterium]|nr:GNAT family N-acetyltransferase [Bacteroidia bacterium]